jgi:iron(III) transport system permease protein
MAFTWAQKLRPMTRRPGTLGWISLVAAAFMLLPTLVVLTSLLEPASDIWSHMAETLLARYVWHTLLLLVGVAAGVISMGVLSAWLVCNYRFPGRDILEWALVLPLAMPAYVMAYAYTDWLQFSGPVQTWLRELTGWQAREYWFPEIRSLGGAIAMLSLALYPYVYLVSRTAFLDMSHSAVEAGRLAGLSPWRNFFRVVVPLARPAIVAGTTLALMETLADFGTVSYFAVEVFTTGIFKAWLSFGDMTAAAQLSACLLGTVVLVMALERLNRGRAAYHVLPRKKPRPQTLRGMPAVLALVACAAPAVFGFLLPAGILVLLAADTSVWTARLWTLIGNNFSVAAITAAIAVTLGTVMAYAARLTKNPAVGVANRLAGLGYAVPGAVIAIGILVPLTRADHFIADGIELLFGLQTGLLLTGTIAALVYAYVVRILAVALQPMEAGLSKITPSMEYAARSLGASPVRTLARVHAPLLASSLLTAALLVFVDIMKELPATLALRPFNFDTLAVTAYNLARDERLAEAAAPSLIIVAIGLLPIIIISRRITRGTRD